MPLQGYPDGAPGSYPNQFAAKITTTSTVASGSTGFLTSTAAVNFGFGASLMKVVADGVGTGYLRMDGNVPTTAAAGSYQLSTSDFLTDWYDFGVQMTGLIVGATSTGFSMRVGAWG